MRLDNNTFRTVIASTPLVSIDLVVCNQQKEILVGRRLNRPAQGFWFVPGGRVQKNESLDSAFSRLCIQELGISLDRSSATLLGIYEHFYPDCVFGKQPGTHYVVIGYALQLSSVDDLQLPLEQHDGYRWLVPEIMQKDSTVHANSRAYICAL